MPTLLILMASLTLGSRGALAESHPESHGESHAAETRAHSPEAAPSSLAPSPGPSPTPDVPLEEVEVTLLGQPCRLQGPLPPDVLRQVHAASPDQLYPVETTGLQVKRALERARAIRRLPAFLDRYRERLTLRLEAQAAYFDALDPALRTKKPAPLVAAAKRHFQAGHGTRHFEAILRNVLAAHRPRSKSAAQFKRLSEELWNEYALHIEPDPEEEFHRAVQGAGIRYDCSFDSAPDQDEDEDDENIPAGLLAPLPSPSPSPAPAPHAGSPKHSGH